MKNFRWKEGVVVALQLKDGTFVLGQLLHEPYIAFFRAFSDDGAWPEDAAKESELLFTCAVTRQLLQGSVLVAHPEIEPRSFGQVVLRQIKTFDGSRRLTVWPGTSRERSFIDLSERPGGSLIEKRIDATAAEQPRVLKKSIPLTDDDTIDAHELAVLWTFPLLNERLFLCKQLGANVDPLKDVCFDRPLRDEYAVFIDMLAQHGSLEDWGYSLPQAPARSPKAGRATPKRTKK